MIAAERYTYNDFESQLFYRDANDALLEQAPDFPQMPDEGKARLLVDLATGGGAAIQGLLDLGKLGNNFRVVGIDLDRSGLASARQRFSTYQDRISLVEASILKLPLQDKACDLITFCNAVHLTDARLALKEAGRVAKKNAVLLLNTAFEKKRAYPEAGMFWIKTTLFAQNYLKAKGFTDIQRPFSPLIYTEEDLRAFTEEAGFTVQKVGYHTAQMDQQAMRAIFNYDEYVKGALPGIPLEAAKEALLAALDELFPRYATNSTIPRNWMWMAAVKF